MKVGDYVQLRSGGPALLIESLKRGKATCVWSDLDGIRQKELFPVAALRHLPHIHPRAEQLLKLLERAARGKIVDADACRHILRDTDLFVAQIGMVIDGLKDSRYEAIHRLIRGDLPPVPLTEQQQSSAFVHLSNYFRG